MRGTGLVTVVAAVAILMTVTIISSGFADDADSDINRFQIFSCQTFAASIGADILPLKKTTMRSL